MNFNCKIVKAQNVLIKRVLITNHFTLNTYAFHITTYLTIVQTVIIDNI